MTTHSINYSKGMAVVEMTVFERAAAADPPDIKIAKGYNLPTGTVLGKITASGKHGPWDPAALDGRANPVGVLFFQSDATEGERSAIRLALPADVRTKLESKAAA